MRKQLSILIFLSSFALAITAYNNSTFLSNYIDERFIGIVFTISSCVTLVILELLPYLTRVLGIKKLGMILFLVGILSGLALGIAVFQQYTVIPILLSLFVLFISSNTSLPFVFDVIAVTENTKDSMGWVRGLFITLTNLAWIVSPILAITLITRYGFGVLFFMSSILLCCSSILFISRKETTKSKIVFERPSLLTLFRELKREKDLLRVLILNFLLQMFYGVMVIFMPLYLYSHIHLAPKAISVIFTVMLMPFLVLSIPLGRIADTRLGEKELLMFGFLCMGFATLMSGIYAGMLTFIWGIILLGTRIGAAIVEGMVDTYFFKKIEGKETSLISIYRSMSPLGYMIGPLIASGLGFVFASNVVFILLGILLILAIPIIILPIHDTK